jgi:hypothetical protein
MEGCVKTLARVLLALVLVLACAASGAAGSTTPQGRTGSPPTPDGIRLTEDAIVGVEIVRIPRGNLACKGAPMSMTFRAVQENLDLPPIPIFAAAIELTDDKGTSKRGWTDSAGLVTITWPANRTGEINFTVRADKEGYDQEGAEEFRIRVEPCRWDLTVDYTEEYAIITEASMVVGAEVHWVGTVRPANPDALEGDAPLKIEGAGTYAAYAKDQIKAPLHVSLEPAVSGSYDIDWEGSIEFGDVLIKVKSVTATFPAMVFIKLTDYTNQYQINYKPPAPWIGTDGNIFTVNQATSLKYSLWGGVVRVGNGPPSFFYTPDQTAWSLSIRLTEIREGTP